MLTVVPQELLQVLDSVLTAIPLAEHAKALHLLVLNALTDTFELGSSASRTVDLDSTLIIAPETANHADLIANSVLRQLDVPSVLIVYLHQSMEYVKDYALLELT